MKKLKLKLDGIKDMLTKEQMKKISGGYSGNYNCVTCEMVMNLGCGGDATSFQCCGNDNDCILAAVEGCANNSCCVSASCG